MGERRKGFSFCTGTKVTGILLAMFLSVYILTHAKMIRTRICNEMDTAVEICKCFVIIHDSCDRDRAFQAKF